MTLSAVTHGAGTTIYGYAMSRSHLVEATAVLGKGVQKAVILLPITTIDHVRVTGTGVEFRSGNKTTSIQHQRDSAQLYQYLQQRSGAAESGGQQVLPAGAGVGGVPMILGATPPASLDRSGNPMKPGSVVPMG